MAISEAEWHQPGTQIYYKQLTEQRRKFKETLLEGFELSSVLESRKSTFLDVRLEFSPKEVQDKVKDVKKATFGLLTKSFWSSFFFDSQFRRQVAAPSSGMRHSRFGFDESKRN